MRLLHCADIHLGRTTMGRPLADGTNSRVREALDGLAWLAATAEVERVDMVVIAGDLFDGRRPTSLELGEASRWLRQMGERYALVLVAGTHDGNAVIGQPESATLRWVREAQMPGVHVYTEPTWDIVEGVVVCALPYPHPATGGDRRERHEAIEQRIEAWLTEAPALRSDLPLLFVGHLSVDGAILGNDRRMDRRWDVAIRPQALAGFDYAALGHLHRRQQVAPNAWYAGSLIRVAFDEEEPKGALVADVAQGEEPRVRAVDFPARPVRTVDLTYLAGAPFDWPEWGGSLRDAMVRLRVDADRRPEAAWRARLEREAYAAGAHYVRVDVTVREAQRQNEGPAARVGPEERLRAWLADRGGADEALLVLARDVMGGAR